MNTELLAALVGMIVTLVGTGAWVWRTSVTEGIRRAAWEREQESASAERQAKQEARLQEQMDIRMKEKQVEIDSLKARLDEERALRAKTEARLEEAQRQITRMQTELNDTQIHLLTASRELDKLHQLQTLVGEQERQILTLKEREQRALNDQVVLERRMMAVQADAEQWQKQYQSVMDRLVDAEQGRAYWHDEATRQAMLIVQYKSELTAKAEEDGDETFLVVGDGDGGDPDSGRAGGEPGGGSGGDPGGGRGSERRGGDPAGGDDPRRAGGDGDAGGSIPGDAEGA